MYKRQDVPWYSFRWSISLFIGYVCYPVFIELSRLLYRHIAYEIDTAKVIATFWRISCMCLILYGWLQSYGVLKQQYVRWCNFRWSSPLSISYVWESNLYRIISTPSCSYGICCRYCHNDRRIQPNFRLFVWFDTFEFNRLPRSNDTMDNDVVFCCSIPLSIDYVWLSTIDMVISTPSCSYCIWKRFCQNRRRIPPNIPLFVWFDAFEFNRLPCSNDKMDDDVAFPDGFCYSSTMFGNHVIDRVISTPSCSFWIWNRYCQNHRRILPNSYCLCDLIR